VQDDRIAFTRDRRDFTQYAGLSMSAGRDDVGADAQLRDRGLVAPPVPSVVGVEEGTMTEAANGFPSTSLQTMSCAAENDERHATCSNPNSHGAIDRLRRFESRESWYAGMLVVLSIKSFECFFFFIITLEPRVE